MLAEDSPTDSRGRVVAVVAAAALILGTLASCRRGADLPPTAPVQGKVTLDGKPLPRGTVTFVPVDAPRGSKSPTAMGNIEDDGTYRLYTVGTEGALVGKHRVAVEAQEEFDETVISMGASLIPARYNMPQTSGLEVEVLADQDNVIDLPLVSGGR